MASKTSPSSNTPNSQTAPFVPHVITTHTNTEKTAAQVAAENANVQIARLQNNIRTDKDELATTGEYLKEAQGNLAVPENQANINYTLYQDYLKEYGANDSRTKTALSEYNNAVVALKPYQSALASVQKQYNAKAAQIASEEATLNALLKKSKTKAAATVTKPKRPSSQNAGGTNGSGLGASKISDVDFTGYTYNAPMVKSAYVGNATKNLGFTDTPSPYTNAFTQAWKDNKPAKGALQMSKTQIQAIQASFPTSSISSGSGFLPDPTPYGFKFLYNPSSVSMSWGLVDSFNPPYEQTGQDPAAAVGAGILSSSITLSLMLNRIGDMTVLNSDGLISSIQTQVPINPNTGYVTGGSSPQPVYPGVTDYYPFNVSNDDLKMIYQKGTMYDLEYLFRTVGGFNATYNSYLNGKTADVGWLQPIPVELHLGNSLRYLVRVSELDVQHIMFNERMVPTLTQVNLTLSRYYDNAATITKVATSGTTNGGTH